MYGLYEGYWSNNTLLFYIVIIVSVFVLLRFVKINIRLTRRTIIDFGFTLSFFILLFVSGFRTTGRDINGGYYANFLTATSVNNYRDHSVEIGFRLINVVFRRLFNNYSAFILFLSFATLLPVFWFVKHNVSERKRPYVLLFYVSTYFFSGFSAARQYLAVSLCLIVYSYLKKCKHFRALIWILLAASIHTSALAMFIPFFITVNKAVSKRMIWLSVGIMFIAVYFFRGSIIGLLGPRYYNYTAFTSVQIGSRWIAYYVPIIYLLYRELRNEKDKYFAKLNVSIIAIGFLFEMLSYVVSIIGRLSALTLPFIYIVPYFIDLEPSQKKRTIYRIILLLYCSLRFWLYLNDHYMNEGLMPYSNLFFSIH